MRTVWRTVRRFLVALPPVPPQALAMFHASVGVAILVGDSSRFAGPTFAGARKIVAILTPVPEDQAWLVWGVLLASVGIFMLFAWPVLERDHPRGAFVLVLFGAAPITFIVLGFVASLGLSSVASTSGIGAYGAVAAFHIHTAVKMLQHGAWDRDRCRTPDGRWERRQSLWR
jgi:cytochrome b561